MVNIMWNGFEDLELNGFDCSGGFWIGIDLRLVWNWMVEENWNGIWNFTNLCPCGQRQPGLGIMQPGPSISDYPWSYTAEMKSNKTAIWLESSMTFWIYETLNPPKSEAELLSRSLWSKCLWVKKVMTIFNKFSQTRGDGANDMIFESLAQIQIIPWTDCWLTCHMLHEESGRERDGWSEEERGSSPKKVRGGGPRDPSLGVSQ